MAIQLSAAAQRGRLETELTAIASFGGVFHFSSRYCQKYWEDLLGAAGQKAQKSMRHPILEKAAPVLSCAFDEADPRKNGMTAAYNDKHGGFAELPSGWQSPEQAARAIESLWPQNRI